MCSSHGDSWLKVTEERQQQIRGPEGSCLAGGGASVGSELCLKWGPDYKAL